MALGRRGTWCTNSMNPRPESVRYFFSSFGRGLLLLLLLLLLLPLVLVLVLVILLAAFVGCLRGGV